MKILYCIPNLEHGGAERQTSYIAVELARLGHEVHVAAHAGGPNLDRLLRAGAVWHCLGTETSECANFAARVRLMRPLATFIRLVKLIREVRPDVVQTILAPMDILGGAAALLTRTPWVLKECSSALLYTTYRRYWLRFALGKLADALISNSEHAKDYWRRAHSEKNLHVIPNAIPMREVARAEYGSDSDFILSPDEKLVFYAGRVDMSKNVEALIAALAKIRDEVPFKALICGEGPKRREAEHMADQLGMADQIIFSGYVDNLWALMKRADAFVSFSRYEGCPNIILEAMACDCALIVSDIPAHREILDDCDALFVKLDEPAEAANAIRTVLTDTAAARARAIAAKENVQKRPSLEDAARRYESVYTNLAQARAASRSDHRQLISFARDDWKL